MCGRGARGRRLARLQQPCKGLPHGHDIADLRGDAAENAVARRFDFDDGLVGLDFEQQLALLTGSPSFFFQETSLPVS